MDFFDELSRGSSLLHDYHFGEAYSVFSDLSTRCNSYEAKFLYPKFISCLRFMKRYDELFYTLSSIRKKYGNSVITPRLLSSSICAYCDVGQFDNALLCYNYALRLDPSLSSLPFWNDLQRRISSKSCSSYFHDEHFSSFDDVPPEYFGDPFSSCESFNGKPIDFSEY